MCTKKKHICMHIYASIHTYLKHTDNNCASQFDFYRVSTTISLISGSRDNYWYEFFKGFIYLVLDRGEGRERKKERNINVWLPLTWPPRGIRPTTQACALPGNPTGNPLIHSVCSIYWATPARALAWLLKPCQTIYIYAELLFYVCHFLLSLMF